MHGRLLGALVAGALLIPAATAPADEPPASVMLSGTARDFRGYDILPGDGLPRGHIDFENNNGGQETGIVTPTLGVDGLPVYAKEGVSSANTNGRAPFDQWFRDVADVNLPEPIALTLDRRSDGSYEYDAPAFFPLDGSGWVRLGREPTRLDSNGRPHNFSFTVELRSELAYTGSESIEIRGDDDIWLFVNGRLALDLGGVHGPLTGTVNLAQRAAALGLVPGRLYDLDLFVAERHTSASSLRVRTPRLGFAAGSATVTATGARPTAGDTLTCETSGWPEDVTLTYAWTRDREPIDGATAATHATTDADGGRALACTITGSRRTTASATAEPIAVAARPVDEPDPPRPDDRPIPLPAPIVNISAGPPAVTRARSATFAFASHGVAHECSFDNRPWEQCSSPFTVSGLNNGDHTLRVRAVAADGGRGPEAVHGFQVDFYRPLVTLDGDRRHLVTGGTVRLQLTCSPREGEGSGFCRGALQLKRTVQTRKGKRRTIVIGRARYDIGAGRSAFPTIRLTASGRRLLRGAPGRRLAVRIALDTTDRAGNRSRASVVRTLALPRR